VKAPRAGYRGRVGWRGGKWIAPDIGWRLAWWNNTGVASVTTVYTTSGTMGTTSWNAKKLPRHCSRGRGGCWRRGRFMRQNWCRHEKATVSTSLDTTGHGPESSTAGMERPPLHLCRGRGRGAEPRRADVKKTRPVGIATARRGPSRRRFGRGFPTSAPTVYSISGALGATSCGSPSWSTPLQGS
jgi:hypothetical protein